MIRVLADQHLYQLKQHLYPSIVLDTYDPVSGWSEHQIRETDALLVRTVNAVNSQTIPSGSRLAFVATASAGRDHLDEHWLGENNVKITDAKGSNAQSVAEYIATCIICWHGFSVDEISNLTAGIIGAGYTGTATAEILETMGIRCILHDPPLQQRSGTFQSAPLDAVLNTDIISFHVPLNETGPHATRKWFDSRKIRAYPKKLVINASRGGVVDEKALLQARHDNHIHNYVCDVWENEPVFDDKTAQNALLATPHIAGYSLEAKRKATEMICNELHNYFGLDKPAVREPVPLFVQIDEIRDSSLQQIIKKIHPIYSYNSAMRKLIGITDDEKRLSFHRIRQDVPLRNEFNRIILPESLISSNSVLRSIGFAAR